VHAAGKSWPENFNEPEGEILVQQGPDSRHARPAHHGTGPGRPGQDHSAGRLRSPRRRRREARRQWNRRGGASLRTGLAAGTGPCFRRRSSKPSVPVTRARTLPMPAGAISGTAAEPWMFSTRDEPLNETEPHTPPPPLAGHCDPWKKALPRPRLLRGRGAARLDQDFQGRPGASSRRFRRCPADSTTLWEAFGLYQEVPSPQPKPYGARLFFSAPHRRQC